jgi:hypothetical protein
LKNNTLPHLVADIEVKIVFVLAEILLSDSDCVRFTSGLRRDVFSFVGAAEAPQNRQGLVFKSFLSPDRGFIRSFQAVIFGGSWGSTLALSYAQKHLSQVKAVICFGIFTGNKQEMHCQSPSLSSAPTVRSLKFFFLRFKISTKRG